MQLARPPLPTFHRYGLIFRINRDLDRYREVELMFEGRSKFLTG